ncbi:ABC transporter permease [Tomitella cavernea]|uniref:ABC3 transporter permease C-terminal domain-containing protein n=1 Tax=Tomitella cavernea TaxID=1387982 RepID=A0ABP9CCY0_9ACTN|nr:ABC transporter permease [Tomitella cavernea]
MIRLVFADVRAQAPLWLWTVLCVTVGAACAAGSVIATLAGVAAARVSGDTDLMQASISLGGNIIFFTAFTAAGVVSSTVGLTLTTRRREHALWMILGIPRRRVRTILRAELAVLGLVAGVIATLPALIAAEFSLRQWAGAGLPLSGVTVRFQPWHLGAAVLCAMVPCLLGGWGITRRVAKTPEMQAFRDVADPPRRPGFLRGTLALCLFIGVVGTWIAGLVTDPAGGVEERVGFVFAGDLFLICLLLLMGPWVLTPLMTAWTALVPARGAAWHIAVQSCRARAARSVTSVLPFALCLSLVGLFTAMGSVMPDGTAGLGDILVVLGWVFVVAWVGGLAVIALVGRERVRDGAIVAVAGARPGVVTRATLYEGVVYAGTAILFGALCVGATGVTLAVAARVDTVTFLVGLPWGLYGGLAAMTLVITCLALGVEAARIARTVPARALRQ